MVSMAMASSGGAGRLWSATGVPGDWLHFRGERPRGPPSTCVRYNRAEHARNELGPASANRGFGLVVPSGAEPTLASMPVDAHESPIQAPGIAPSRMAVNPGDAGFGVVLAEGAGFWSLTLGAPAVRRFDSGESLSMMVNNTDDHPRGGSPFALVEYAGGVGIANATSVDRPRSERPKASNPPNGDTLRQ